MYALSIIFAAGALPLFASPASKPTVVHLRLWHDSVGQKLEEKFIDEMGLVLDDFHVVAVQAPGENFSTRALSVQIAMVRTLAVQRQAVAVVWLVAFEEKYILLHLVALGTDRTLVRTVQAGTDTGTPTSLAIAVRELLGAAYLFAPTDKTPAPALQKVAESVRLAIIPDRPWRHLWLEGALTGRITASNGSHAQAGLGAALSTMFAQRFRVSAGIEALFGPVVRRNDFRMRGAQASAAVAAGYVFSHGNWQWGPYLALGIDWQRLAIRAGKGPGTSVSFWRTRTEPGLGLGWQRGTSTQYFVRVGNAISLQEERVRRQSDGRVLWATSLSTWVVRLGCAIDIGR